jgi:hypothetical protein
MQILHASDGMTARFTAAVLTPRLTGVDWIGILMVITPSQRRRGMIGNDIGRS